ncbi:alkaline phosphatase family protein [Pseudonocardia endophytica]|uniref:Phosphoglycerate mutase n=1 Tax=Pseudonocardia endophytica TaxID=401976 RepID=A0A4R1I0S7_PSEEN|nr:alkaline phosphatase family protein [Pseudonocardia endophytica]TCK27501.1 phosphoglycerate mutase [Pseudonocardia endophytica]
MRPAGHGETQPRLDDDRLPVVLVVLDGLGDRPIPELDGRTPSEAARTPNLDALAANGCTGWHLPFGWGPAPASELAHWAMFGYDGVPFPGRAVLEALGAGLAVPGDTAVTHAALRTSEPDGDKLWITGRAGRGDEEDAAALFAELDPVDATLLPLGARGEALLTAPGCRSGAVTDSDPFFETVHPWLRPVPTAPEGGAFAALLGRLLPAVRGRLLASPVNERRRADGLPALDVLTTKWSGSRGRIPPFAERNGVAGAAVTSTRLYRGIAAALDIASTHLSPVDDHGADMAARLDAARELIADGARFVHVHTKATDEAGHTKDSFAKRDVLEALDPGLAGLAELSRDAVVAVTGDHATPSTHGVMHAGEPTPLAVAGPTVRADDVTAFGERPAAAGWYGRVRAAELLPLLFGHANRAVFLGHRITRDPVPALADDPEPLPP